MRRQTICRLLLLIGLATPARGQLLNGDANFPILHEIRWNSGMDEVRGLCEARHVVQTSKDSAMVINVPMLGYAARTEVQFDRDLKTIKLIQVKFDEATASLVDSVTSHFTRTMGHKPMMTVKEKSLIIFTVRIEVASWKSRTGAVSLFAGKRGDSLFSASLLMGAPTTDRTNANRP
jgi:hypothetical protein